MSRPKVHLCVYPSANMARTAFTEVSKAASHHQTVIINTTQLFAFYSDTNLRLQFSYALSESDAKRRFMGIKISSFNISNSFGPHMRELLRAILGGAVVAFEEDAKNDPP